MITSSVNRDSFRALNPNSNLNANLTYIYIYIYIYMSEMKEHRSLPFGAVGGPLSAVIEISS